MTAEQESRNKKQDWKKIGPYLYRYKGGAYYGLEKHRGKQIRRFHHCVETDNLALAQQEAEGLAGRS